MRHQDLTINHRLESWVYANDAARTGATGFVAGDVGRLSFQTDTKQYWRLTATGPPPAWALIGPPAAAPLYASLQTAQLNPAVTNLVSPGAMMGLGVGNTITPTATGKLLVTIAGTLGNTLVKVPAAQMRYGTGTPPANGASGVTGIAIGAQALRAGPSLNGEAVPFSLTALLTGAAIGFPVWFDLQVWTNAGGQAWVAAVTISAAELP